MSRFFTHVANFKKFVRSQFSTDFDNFWFFEKFYVSTLQEKYIRVIRTTLEAPNRANSKNVTWFTETPVRTFLLLEISEILSSPLHTIIIADMEIAMLLPFGWITKEAPLKSGRDRNLETFYMACSPVRSGRFLWSLLTILSIGLSTTNHNLLKLENHLVSVMLYKEISKQIFRSPKMSKLPGWFWIWGFQLVKITPETCPEQWECADQPVSQVSAGERLCHDGGWSIHVLNSAC